MPYRTNEDLPVGVRRHLPQRAQSIYREAFNRAWMSYRNSWRQEEIAHRVAWAAVKRRYQKTAGGWRPRTQIARARSPRQGDRPDL